MNETVHSARKPPKRTNDPERYLQLSYESMYLHVQLMLQLMDKGAITFDYGNNIRARAKEYEEKVVGNKSKVVSELTYNLQPKTYNLQIQNRPQPLLCFLQAHTFSGSIIYQLIFGDFTYSKILGIWMSKIPTTHR